MRRTYYIHYYDPDNPMVYRLYYCALPIERRLLPEGCRQITCKHAIQLASLERVRRKRKRPDAGLSDAAVFPAGYEGSREDLESDPGYKLVNYLWLPLSSEC